MWGGVQRAQGPAAAPPFWLEFGLRSLMIFNKLSRPLKLMTFAFCPGPVTVGTSGVRFKAALQRAVGQKDPEGRRHKSNKTNRDPIGL